MARILGQKPTCLHRFVQGRLETPEDHAVLPEVGGGEPQSLPECRMRIRRITLERICMSQQVLFKLELPEDLDRFQLPRGVDERLYGLLDRQDRGEELTLDERREAEGLVDLAELLSLLKLRAQRA